MCILQVLFDTSHEHSELILLLLPPNCPKSTLGCSYFSPSNLKMEDSAGRNTDSPTQMRASSCPANGAVERYKTSGQDVRKC